VTLIEQIEKQLSKLPPEKQSEVLDFITFLQQQAGLSKPAKKRSLRKHAAFGSWKHRNINAIQYQQNLRSEWGE
jgi:mRNA-degrading endonuclease RelE of RelBE toxin-antitoxin system